MQAQIMRDRTSGNSRGSEFVTFDTEDAVEKVLENIKDHKLLDKWVECKKAIVNKTNTTGRFFKQNPRVFLIVSIESGIWLWNAATRLLRAKCGVCSTTIIRRLQIYK